MNIDGTGLTQLTSDASLEQQPAWSPDGTKIAFQGSVIEQYDIFVVDSTGGTPVDVTNTAANGQPFLVAGRHAGRLHVGPRRERRDLPTETWMERGPRLG